MSHDARFPLSGRDYPDAPEAWHWDALCAQIAPEEWFLHHRDRKPGGLSHGEVVATCQRCPVMRYCLAASLDIPGLGPEGVEEFGVWAGANYWHRREFKRAIRAGVASVDEIADWLRIRPAHAVVRLVRARVEGRAADNADDRPVIEDAA